MHLSANELVGLLDRIGIVAFALSGVEVGARRRFDVFGLLVIGIVTATGGGLMRDVVLEQPPRVLERWDYLVWAAVASVAGIILVAIGRRVPRWLPWCRTQPDWAPSQPRARWPAFTSTSRRQRSVCSRSSPPPAAV